MEISGATVKADMIADEASTKSRACKGDRSSFEGNVCDDPPMLRKINAP